MAKKSWWQRFLDKLAAVNEKEYGNDVPDCCAECEPYLTVDHRLMIEKTAELISGIKIMMKAAGVSKGVIAVEDNKPEAL